MFEIASCEIDSPQHRRTSRPSPPLKMRAPLDRLAIINTTLAQAAKLPMTPDNRAALRSLALATVFTLDSSCRDSALRNADWPSL